MLQALTFSEAHTQVGFLYTIKLLDDFLSLYSTALFSDYGFVTSSGRMVVNSWLKTRRKESPIACLVLHIMGPG